MLQQTQSSEPWMNGAAVVLSDGREVPITDTMVQQSLEALASNSNDAAKPARRAS
ncbi:PA1571 family protein [Marinobacter salicampi]|uniref:PA1571 family protein n=1 Tax=Marinobacter salicampi TaxID=435907 RepID=UPI00140C4427|nr:PA1571 family protein [Marinobacter salicampi]